MGVTLSVRINIVSPASPARSAPIKGAYQLTLLSGRIPAQGTQSYSRIRGYRTDSRNCHRSIPVAERGIKSRQPRARACATPAARPSRCRSEAVSRRAPQTLNRCCSWPTWISTAVPAKTMSVETVSVPTVWSAQVPSTSPANTSPWLTWIERRCESTSAGRSANAIVPPLPAQWASAAVAGRVVNPATVTDGSSSPPGSIEDASNDRSDVAVKKRVAPNGGTDPAAVNERSQVALLAQ